jgi:phosphoglycerate dehydrogenase-like enzyme
MGEVLMTKKTNKSRMVLITANIEEHWLERLQSLSPDLQIERWPTRSARAIPDDFWQDVEILYTSYATPLPLPEQAPQLRWVQFYSAGVDRVLKHPLFHTSVIFTTASGVHAINMAEYVLTMALAWSHQLPRLLEWQQRGQWPSNAERASMFVSEEVRGKTIGLVGYGSIGRQVAWLAKAFGMRVLAMQRSTDHRDHHFLFPGVGDPEGILPDRYYPPDQLHSLLSESDIVVIAVPLTPKTQELFDDVVFQAMKSTAFLVNIARGDICNEAALVRALEEKQIGGAALDVFHREPLSPDHPLWRLPNVFISPHTAGLTPQYDERAATIFGENLRRYFVGEPLYNVVDKTQGY